MEVEIGSRNPEARHSFFGIPGTGAIKKGRRRVELPAGAYHSEIVEYIDSLKSREYLRLNQAIVSPDWMARAKKENQSEAVNHGPYRMLSDSYGVPALLIKQALGRIEEPYAMYAWMGNDGIKRFFRTVDILIAGWLYDSSELIGEGITVEGSKREYCCTVSSRDTRMREKKGESKKHKITFINLPIEGECGTSEKDILNSWRNLETTHHCEYKSNNAFVHYKTVSFDCHDIATLWALKDAKAGMMFDVFPRPSERGMQFFDTARDRVIVRDPRTDKDRNTTYTEIDVLLQYEIIRSGAGNIFNFTK